MLNGNRHTHRRTVPTDTRRRSDRRRWRRHGAKYNRPCKTASGASRINETLTFNYLNKSRSLITEATYYSEIGVNKIDDVGVTGMLPAEAQNMPVTNYPKREIATR